MATAVVDEISIGYDDEGRGLPLVLIHGHPFDRSMWAPQVAEFSRRGCRVIAADLRGYGQSTVCPAVDGLETFARDVFGLLDHLGLGEVVLGGLSMGGQVAMECLRHFAPRIRGLLLADTFAQADGAEPRAARESMADRLLAEGMAGYAEEVLPRMIAPYNVTGQPAVAAQVRAMMSGAPAAGAAAALRGRARRPDYVELLAGVAVPTLVVVGRDDEFTPVAVAERLCRGIPGGTLAVIDGAGHLPNLERPAGFNLAVAGLLARVAR